MITSNWGIFTLAMISLFFVYGFYLVYRSKKRYRADMAALEERIRLNQARLELEAEQYFWRSKNKDAIQRRRG